MPFCLIVEIIQPRELIFNDAKHKSTQVGQNKKKFSKKLNYNNLTTTSSKLFYIIFADIFF